MDKYNVSVLLALYNGEKYIKAQLESLYQQSVTIDQLIVTDDGSTDDSFNIVGKFIKDHDLVGKWIAIKNDMNLGPSANFIQMCKRATGDYIFFCDQDDIWMPDKVEKMCDIMSHNHDINLLYADVINTSTPEDRIMNDMQKYSGRIELIGFNPENYFFKGLGCATCIKHSFVDQVIQYWTTGWEHDMFFWACAVMTGSGYRYDYPVIWRRIHDSNVSMHEVKTLEKRKKQVGQSMKRPGCMIKLLDDLEINDAVKRSFLKNYERALIRRRQALERRNIFIGIDNLFTGREYYLHKEKGAVLDLVLIIFGKYNM